MDKNTEFKNQRIVNVKYIIIGKDIPLNKKPNPLKKNTSFWVNKFEINNKFPKTKINTKKTKKCLKEINNFLETNIVLALQ